MPHYKEVWPLALILAMASGSSGAVAPVDTQTPAFFQAGSLSETLRSASDAIGEKDDRSGMNSIQLSQWFNFGNCFSGVWRRC